MYKILIVEDELVIARTIADHLQKWDYRTRYVEDFHRVLDAFLDFTPDLVLMDVNLPCYSGHYWCAEIRKLSEVPIIFVSSISDQMNIVMAMNMGGDEYIEKPYDIYVLTAKIQAMLRRAYGIKPLRESLQYKEMSLDTGSMNLICNGEEILLTKNEYLILKLLLEHKQQVVSRETLMEVLWGNDEFVDDNTLTVNVTRVRKKLENAGCGDYLKTKKGVGYIVE